jgi:hypothetical protein
MNMPVTKLSLLRGAMAAGDWHAAIAIASKFGDLGTHKAPIMSAREAYTRPDFQRQLGRDPEALKTSGIAALKERYGE